MTDNRQKPGILRFILLGIILGFVLAIGLNYCSKRIEARINKTSPKAAESVNNRTGGKIPDKKPSGKIKKGK